ncbi:MAG: hypothetical protein CMJ83_02225 [Planctomycetes bacterium]|nr:hypothetical protein [Planctomycetota bacterium]
MWVLETGNSDRGSYANSLLSVAEFLSTQAIRPPAVASAMNSGGKLERRLTMIISNHLPKTPRWLLSTVLAVGAGLLPLSVAYAQDVNAVERRLDRAIGAGEITPEQAKVMTDALRRAARQGGDKRGPGQDALKRRYAEAERRIRIAIKEGKLSREAAVKKLTGIREQLFGQSPKKRSDADKSKQRQRRTRYAELERRLKASVVAGRLSSEDAKKRLIDAKKRIVQAREKMSGKAGGKQVRDEGALRRRYGELQRRVKAAVDAGQLSREDAEKRLIDARKKMFGKPGRRR